MAALVLAAPGCGSGGETDGERTEPTGESVTVTVYLTDEDGVALDCAAVRSIGWEVPAAEPGRASESVRRAIQDVRPSPSLHPEGTAPLAEYFVEVRVEAGVAIVSFDEGALVYLNSTACMQAVTKTPIVRTLLGFPDIDEVVWEIDGEIFDAWDA